MTEEIAKDIFKMRTEKPIHSLRRIAEVVCEKYPNYINCKYGTKAHKKLHGNQLLGKDLVEEAAKVIVWPYWQDSL